MQYVASFNVNRTAVVQFCVLTLLMLPRLLNGSDNDHVQYLAMPGKLQHCVLSTSGFISQQYVPASDIVPGPDMLRVDY